MKNFDLIYSRNLLIFKFGLYFSVFLLVFHLFTGTSIERILSLDLSMIALFSFLLFIIKKKKFIYTITILFLFIINCTFFLMTFLDTSEKSIVNLFFLFIPAIACFLFSNLMILFITVSTSYVFFVVNIIFKSELLFYEGFPLVYIFYFSIIYLMIFYIGYAQTKTSNKIEKEKNNSFKNLELEKQQSIDLLKKIEETSKNVNELNYNMNSTFDNVNKVTYDTKDIVKKFNNSFNKNLDSLNKFNEDINDLNKNITLMKNISVETDNSISNSKNNVENSISKSNELLTSFSKIKENSSKNLNISSEFILSSKEMHKIIDIIDSISAKINILAINASIEASRVGVEGKGFSVIASEIKNLSFQSSEATTSISEILNNLKVQIEKSVELSESSNYYIENSLDFLNVSKDYLNKTLISYNDINNNINSLKNNVSNVEKFSYNSDLIFKDILKNTKFEKEELNNINKSIELLEKSLNKKV